MRLFSFVLLFIGLALLCVGSASSSPVPGASTSTLSMAAFGGGIICIIASPLLFLIGGRRARERKEAQRHAEMIEAIKSK